MTSASIYAFELPTTGSFSFTDWFSDASNTHTSQIAEATQVRADLRAVLKESKRTDGEKDHLRVVKVSIGYIMAYLYLLYFAKVLDDYIPHLYGVIACVASGDIVQLREPGLSCPVLPGSSARYRD